MRVPRFKAAIAASTVAMLALSACAESERGNEPAEEDAELVFGSAGEAKMLDPTFATDGETFRVVRQIYDTLLQVDPATSEITPHLATAFEPDDTGTVWTFTLREGVKFHDGTDFNAEAVCFNFDRWYNSTGLLQLPDVTQYWQYIMEGFASNEREDLGESLYQSCTASDELTAVIELSRASSKFPAALVLPAFSMHSPAALEQYNADNLSGDAENVEDIVFPEYALEHPTGTGPFRFDSWNRADQTITLVRNDDYWGEPATISRLIFRAIPDENGRRQALLSGDIDAYDLPSPSDWQALQDAGMTLEQRPAFNILYIAFTQDHNPALEKLEVRQAIAHAINRQAIVDAKMPEGAEVATQFQPPSIPGWNPNVQTYEYDPDRARELLAEAGEEDLTVEFWWPTDVTRPYMPDPQGIFELIQADLEAVGITVEPTAAPWNPDYLGAVQNGESDLHLLGWTGDYVDAYNFIGTFFGQPLPQWGYDYPELWERMAEADGTPDLEPRYALYEELNAMIMEYLPGVPVSHTPNAIVFAPYVSGIQVSPLANERFHTAVVSE